MPNQHTKRREAEAAKKKALRNEKLRAARANGKKKAEEAKRLGDAIRAGQEGGKKQESPITVGKLKERTEELKSFAEPVFNVKIKFITNPPTFTLKATDNIAPVVLQEWIELAQANGVSEKKILAAKEALAEMEAWRTNNPLKCKTPD